MFRTDSNSDTPDRGASPPRSGVSVENRYGMGDELRLSSIEDSRRRWVSNRFPMSNDVTGFVARRVLL